MTVEPADELSDSSTPLTGFDFTRGWLDGNAQVRAALPSVQELLQARAHSLNTEGSPTTWQPWTPDEIQELKQFNIDGGNSAGAAMCDLLADPSIRAVVTGQQPNLLVSPLYILYKALSAGAWARKLTAELGRKVIPIFWVASDDDDFAELKHAWMPTWQGDLLNVGRRISRGGNLASGAPAFRWDLTESIPRLSADIKRALDGWPNGMETANWLISQIQSQPNFERSFCRLLSHLLGNDFPVIFVAPRLAVMRRRGAQVLAADVTRHRDINRAVNTAAESLTDKGYPVSLARDTDALNLFWLNVGRRCRLIRADNKISAIDPATQRQVAQFSETELLERLQNYPEEFAPNVITRPLVQDTALPSLLYIGGPGELAYLAALGVAYQKLGLPRSAVAARTFITLNGGKGSVKSWAEKNPAAVLQQNDTGAALQAELAMMMKDMESRLQTMRQIAATTNGIGIDASLEKTQAHILRGIGQLKQRLARQISPAEWQHHSRAATVYHPAGKSQERMLNPWTFVDQGRWDSLAKYLYTAVDFSAAGPHTIELPPWIKNAI